MPGKIAAKIVLMRTQSNGQVLSFAKSFEVIGHRRFEVVVVAVDP